MKASGTKAVKLDQMSQIVTTLSRDMARRAELALTMRYGNNSEEELCL